MIAFDHDGKARYAQLTAKGVKLHEAIFEGSDVRRRDGRVGVRRGGRVALHVAK